MSADALHQFGEFDPKVVVIQPTPFCNIDCTYCYLADRDKFHVMTGDTLARIFEQLELLAPARQQVTVIWHAGEPMVLGAQWYREAFDRIAQSSRIEAQHCLQTNATLLTPDWCHVLRDYRVQLGVSLDGPADIQDAHRKTRAGSGTFDTVAKGLRLLEANGVDFGVICVVTDKSVGRPEDLFDFFDGLGIRQIAFNCEELKGVNRRSSLAADHHLEQYKFFLSTFWRLTQDSKRKWNIRDINQVIDRLAGVDTTPNHTLNTVGNILSFTYSGDVSTFSPELMNAAYGKFATFALGNIHEDSLQDLLSSPLAASMACEINAGIEKCRADYSYFAVCGGGDPASKIFENGSFNSTETQFCRFTVQAPTDIILAELDAGVGRRLA